VKRKPGKPRRSQLRALERQLESPRVSSKQPEASRESQREADRVRQLVNAFDEALDAMNPLVEQRMTELDREAEREVIDGAAALDRMTAAFDGVVTRANAIAEHRIDALANEPAVMPLGEIADALFARIDGETTRALRDSTAALRQACQRVRPLTTDEGEALLEQLDEIQRLFESEALVARQHHKRAEYQLAQWIEHASAARAAEDAVLIDGAIERVDEWVSRVSEAEVEVDEYRESLVELDELRGQIEMRLIVNKP